MKILKDRQEIAKAMNFGKYPVLYLDLAKDELQGYENCYKGQRIKMPREWNGEKFWSCGNLAYWGDTNEMTITGEGACLKAGFGYGDIEQMIINANAMEVKGEQEVVVVIINSKTRQSSYPVLTKTSKYNKNCMTAMKVEGDFKIIIDTLK